MGEDSTLYQTAAPSVAADPAQPDDTEPTPERQAELQAAHEANLAAGEAPYAHIPIRSRGEVVWIYRERNWSGEFYFQPGQERPNFSDADLYGVDLNGAFLDRANLRGANLSQANLSEASIFEADLRGSFLSRINLSHAALGSANLSGAHLVGANLSGANFLGGANLTDADLREADL